MCLVLVNFEELQVDNRLNKLLVLRRWLCCVVTSAWQYKRGAVPAYQWQRRRLVVVGNKQDCYSSEEEAASKGAVAICATPRSRRRRRQRDSGSLYTQWVVGGLLTPATLVRRTKQRQRASKKGAIYKRRQSFTLTFWPLPPPYPLFLQLKKHQNFLKHCPLLPLKDGHLWMVPYKCIRNIWMAPKQEEEEGGNGDDVDRYQQHHKCEAHCHCALTVHCNADYTL